MGRAAAVLTAMLREVFAREELPPASTAPAASPPASRPGLLRSLLAAEPLPGDLPPRARPAGRGALSRLFAPDDLPLDEPVPRRPGRWLAWLFAPERLDP
jgi:hypothetical protein